MTKGRKPLLNFVQADEKPAKGPSAARYTKHEKQEIVERLFNAENYALVARETGVSIKSLRTWKAEALKNGRPVKKDKVLVEELQRVVFHLLETLPETSEIKTPALAITIGTLIDKYILLSGGATSRSEKIISALSDEDLTQRLAEAKATLALPVTIDEIKKVEGNNGK